MKNEQQAKKYEIKKTNSIQDRIKNLQNNMAQNKKEEIKKEDKKPSDPSKPLSMAERIKMMSGNIRMPAPAPEGPQKRHSSALENKLNFKPSPMPKNEDKNKNDKKENKPAVFGDNKFSQMKKMLENRGPRIMGGPRPSAQIMGMPRLGNLAENNNKQNMEIIEEKSDKLSSGYNPVDDLEKKLEKVVVKKDKKKKKKPTFEY